MVGKKVLFCLGAEIFPKLRREQRNQCWTFRGVTCVFLVLIIWGIFLYFVIFLINRIGSKLGGVEGCSIGGGVGSDSCVFTLRYCETGFTLGAVAGMMVISGGWIFSFWICGSIGGNSKTCMRGWAVLIFKMWAIWLIDFFVASP